MKQSSNTIHVIDNYYIIAEEGFYTLAEKYTGIRKKTGEEYEALRNLGYYCTLEQVLIGIIRKYEQKTVSDNAVSDVKDLIDKLSILEETWLKSLSTHVSEHVKK